MLALIRKSNAPQILAIGLGISMLTAAVHLTGAFEAIEYVTIDQRCRLLHAFNKHILKRELLVSDKVVLVGVDEKSVTPETSRHADRWGGGGWFTRDHWTDGIVNLSLWHKPKVVALDFLFQEFRGRVGDVESASDQLDQELDSMFRKNTGTFRSLLDQDENRLLRQKVLAMMDSAFNARFAHKFDEIEMSRMNGASVPHFVTGYYFTSSAQHQAPKLDPHSEKDKAKLETIARELLPENAVQNVPADYPWMDNISLPFSDLAIASVGLGYLDVPRDPDHVVRRVPLIYGFKDPTQGGKPCFVPSLSLKACLIYLGINPAEMDEKNPLKSPSGMMVDFGREIRLWNPSRVIRVPIDQHGRLFLNFRGRIEDYRGLPFVAVSDSGDVYHAKEQNKVIPQERIREAGAVSAMLKDSVAFVGQTFTGGSDTGPCSIDSNAPLVLTHMTAADNILEERFMKPSGFGTSLAYVSSLPFLIALMNLHPRARICMFLTLYLFVGTVVAAILFFQLEITILPIALPASAITVCFGMISIYRYQAEFKDKLVIRKRFSAMVSGRVLSYIEDHPECLKGERREASMFFSDVAGFTALSETLDPQDLSKILNDYLTPMSRLILARDGYLNKYAGDGIMAVWGVPSPSDDHAVNACLCAIEQQEKIRELGPMFKERYNVTLHVRMGINSGSVSAGAMGSQERFEYTVMGDPVNFAARLEPSNKDYGTLIMIGENTYTLAREKIEARLLDRLIVYGKKEPVGVYELVGRKGGVAESKLKAIRKYEEGLKLYWERKWEEAAAALKECIAMDPDEKPAKVILERVEHFKSNPPPPEWKGEYERKSK
jgi:adenylate cyclase